MLKNTDKTIQEIHNENLARFTRRIDQCFIFYKPWVDVVSHAEKQHTNGIVDKQDCWIWNSTVFRRKRAYGEDRLQPWLWIVDPVLKTRKQVYARRFAWFLVTGFELRPGHAGQWLGLFKCHNDACVNPYHGTVLTAGNWLRTMSDQITEEYRKGLRPNPMPSAPVSPDFDPLAAEIAANSKKA